MSKRLHGYTLVELLVVISTMGILLAIGVVSYGSYINWSNDRARESDTRNWVATFDLYKSRYFVYPLMPTSSLLPTVACLGATDTFPTATASIGANKCGQFKSSNGSSYASTNSGLAAAVARVGNVPKNSHEDSGKTIVDSVLVGPIIYLTQSSDINTIPVTARFINFFKNDCPGGFTESTNVASDFPLLSGVKPSGSSAKVCYLQKDFTYTPSS